MKTIMTRDKFLRELRIALQGRIPQAQVNGHLEYYETYIIEESRKGRTEEQVLFYLGNPRLIAKTIIDTYGGGILGEGQTAETQQKKQKKFRVNSWYGRLSAGILVIVFLYFLLRIGIVLLPVLSGAFMIGSIAFVMYRIFFGKK